MALPSAYVRVAGNIYGPNNITLIYFNGTVIPTSDCTVDTCSLLLGFFRYVPNFGANAFFVAVFALLTLIQVPLGIRGKTWSVMIAMVCGLLLEVIGYVSRLLSSKNPFSFGPFAAMTVCLTLAPAFFTAAIYFCLSRIIKVYGEANARFSPRTYAIGFITSDVVALLLQAAGGGLAAKYLNVDANKAKQGSDVLIAGLAWQVASLTIFGLMVLDIAIKVRKGQTSTDPACVAMRKTRRWKGFLMAMGIASVAIYARSIYRVAELADGFTGTIASQEVPFIVLEGCMNSLACILLTIFHPAVVFRDIWRKTRLGGGPGPREAEAGLEMAGGRKESS